MGVVPHPRLLHIQLCGTGALYWLRDHTGQWEAAFLNFLPLFSRKTWNLNLKKEILSHIFSTIKTVPMH